MSSKKIVVLIPCKNEEKGVREVIRGLPLKNLKSNGFTTQILVIDNNSTDKTARIARQNHAAVVFEEREGKGNAIRTGFHSLPADFDYLVIIDGDNTYKTSEIPRLIEPLISNFADVIVGSRLSGKINRKSLSAEHKIVNWIFTFLVRHFYKVNTTDVLSGFMALKKRTVNDLKKYVTSKGFAVEMEMNIKASRLGYKIYSVPISYDIRTGESKIEGLTDAIQIFYTFLKYLFWKPAPKNY